MWGLSPLAPHTPHYPATPWPGHTLSGDSDPTALVHIVETQQWYDDRSSQRQRLRNITHKHFLKRLLATQPSVSESLTWLGKLGPRWGGEPFISIGPFLYIMYFINEGWADRKNCCPLLAGHFDFVHKTDKHVNMFIGNKTLVMKDRENRFSL